VVYGGLAMMLFTPSSVAYARGHHQLAAIGPLNVPLGWGIALVWAMTVARPKA
jgi:hypothetical protein